MTPFLRRIPAIAIALALVIAVSAHATSSLSFEGGGYWVDLEIGDSAQPAIAAVRFHAPGDSHGVPLDTRLVAVTTFDTAQRTLVLRYAGGEQGVAPFTLSVHDRTAVLETGAKRVVADFDWTM